MATIQQKFEQYLIANHKEEFEKFISEQIELAKSKTYYVAHQCPSSFVIHKTEQTIGEACKDVYQIFNAFTGEDRHNVDYGKKVGSEIEEQLHQRMDEILNTFTSENFDLILREVLEKSRIEGPFDVEDLAQWAVDHYILSGNFYYFYDTFAPGGLFQKLLDRDDMYDRFNIVDFRYGEYLNPCIL